MPQLLFIDAKWEGKIELTKKLADFIKKQNPRSIALFASVQFTNLTNLIEQMKKLGIKINITKAKRTNKSLQVLGCDCHEDSFKDPIIQNSDLILYVGDGLFHPKALLLSQINKKNPTTLVIFNPIADKVELINSNAIFNQLKKAKRNLKLFINANTIGILVTIKPGQQYLQAAKKLKEKLEEEGKKAYIFIDDTININDLENYPFIQAWVNTACPRIGTDDILNTNHTLINLREAINPIKALEDLENAE